MTKRALLSLVAAAALCACEQPETYAATVRFNLPADKLPDPLEVPWPSDLYKTDADGTISDGIVRWTNAGLNPARQALEAYGALDGFGRNCGALFLVDEEVELDASTLPAWGESCAAADSTVLLLDIDPASPSPGRRVPCYSGISPGTRVLVVGPHLEVLAPGRTYAAVITTGVGANGGKLGPASAFREIRDGAGSARATGAGKLYGDAVDAVARLAKLDKKRIAALTVFTTQTEHRKLKALRDALVAGSFGPAPAVITAGLPAPLGLFRFGQSAHPGWTATLSAYLGTPRLDTNGRHLTGAPGGPEPEGTGIAHDAIGAVLTAAYESPNLLRASDGTLGRNSTTIAWNADGSAVVQGTATVPFTLVLPLPPAPAAGYPVVIFQHGAGQQRATASALANELARAGIATIAIDAPFHGLRAPGASDTSSLGKGSYTGPDGHADTFADLNAARLMLADFSHGLAARDHLWQAVIDLAQLRRLIARGLELPSAAEAYGGASPKLDPARVGYVGMSMGGFLGTLFAAVEPKASVDPFVLNVAPAAAATIGFADGQQGPGAGLWVSAATGLPIDNYDGRLRLMPQLVQGLLDGADPGSFAADVADGDHNVWLLNAEHDEAGATESFDLLARAMKFPQLVPNIRALPGLEQVAGPLRAGDLGGRVQAFFSAAPANHALLLGRWARQIYEPPWPRQSGERFPRLSNPPEVRQPVVGAQRAVIDFLLSTWAGAPELAIAGPAYPGLVAVPDFDDDGFCDATEVAAGTSQFDAASKPAGAPDCVRDVGFDFP